MKIKKSYKVLLLLLAALLSIASLLFIVLHKKEMKTALENKRFSTTVKDFIYYGVESAQDALFSENTLLFASIANWYSGATFDMLQNLANHGQICDDILDGCTVTKALLQYYPLTNELYIYKLSSDEDEHNHVINETLMV